MPISLATIALIAAGTKVIADMVGGAAQASKEEEQLTQQQKAIREAINLQTNLQKLQEGVAIGDINRTISARERQGYQYADMLRVTAAEAGITGPLAERQQALASLSTQQDVGAYRANIEQIKQSGEWQRMAMQRGALSQQQQLELQKRNPFLAGGLAGIQSLPNLIGAAGKVGGYL